MPAVDLFSDRVQSPSPQRSGHGVLPQLLQTPSGLAILEIQGTVHAQLAEVGGEALETNGNQHATQTPIGRLEFPDFNLSKGLEDTKWMKKVYLYVGKHQRLLGEVKRLPKPLLILRKRSPHARDDEDFGDITNESTDAPEQLEILEVVEHKIIFVGRPEPVGE